MRGAKGSAQRNCSLVTFRDEGVLFVPEPHLESMIGQGHLLHLQADHTQKAAPCLVSEARGLCSQGLARLALLITYIPEGSCMGP